MSEIKRSVGLPMVCAVLTLGLSACGGSSGGTTTAPNDLAAPTDTTPAVLTPTAQDPINQTQSGSPDQQPVSNRPIQPANTQVYTDGLGLVQLYYPQDWVFDDTEDDVRFVNPITATSCGITSRFIPGSSLAEGVAELQDIFATPPETRVFELNGSMVARLSGPFLFNIPTVIQVAYDTDIGFAHSVICIGDTDEEGVQQILDSMFVL